VSLRTPELRQGLTLLTIALLAVIAYLSLSPPSPHDTGGMPMLRFVAESVLGDPDAEDKVGHFLAYAALGFVSLLAWPGRPVSVLALATLYGGLMELGQMLVAGRSASWGDLLADGLGALAGVLFLLTLRRIQFGVLRWPGR
jgi:VanZ family protein